MDESIVIPDAIFSLPVGTKIRKILSLFVISLFATSILLILSFVGYVLTIGVIVFFFYYSFNTATQKIIISNDSIIIKTFFTEKAIIYNKIKGLLSVKRNIKDPVIIEKFIFEIRKSDYFYLNFPYDNEIATLIAIKFEKE